MKKQLVFAIVRTDTNAVIGIYHTWNSRDDEQKDIRAQLAQAGSYWHRQANGRYAHKWAAPKHIIVAPLEECQPNQSRDRRDYYRKNFKASVKLALSWIEAQSNGIGFSNKPNKLNEPENELNEPIEPVEPIELNEATQDCPKCMETFPLNTTYFLRWENSENGFMARCKQCSATETLAEFKDTQGDTQEENGSPQGVESVVEPSKQGICDKHGEFWLDTGCQACAWVASQERR